jgi:hypothetical protein
MAGRLARAGCAVILEQAGLGHGSSPGTRWHSVG